VLAFWVIASGLAAAVVILIIRPLRAPLPVNAAGAAPDMAASGSAASSTRDNDAASDLAVYRDQLAELDSDVARGVLPADEAAAARVEISRRLLARADRVAGQPVVMPALSPLTPLIASIGVPLVGLGFYLLAGVPWMPDQPRAGRVNSAATVSADRADVAELVARVEKRIADNPDDGRGWDVIAPVYLKLNRMPEAIRAYGHALRLNGDSVPRLAGLAEAHVKMADGVVNESAKTAYTRILQLEPGRFEPRFWLAVGLEQDGQRAQAAAAFRGLLTDAPADAPWRGTVLERLAAIDPAAAAAAGAPSGRGPTADDVTAAGQMTPAARATMIAGMVAGLEQRLNADGRDVDGWQKLLRAHMVLGQKDKAMVALRNARAALAGDKAGLSAVNAAAKELGVGS
jgi:cytochrome c-type biogenesis protein CcmH